MSAAPLLAPSPANPLRWEGHSICWSAIFAGALTALSLTVEMVVLGSAFGFGSMSPFAGDGLPIAAIGTAAILWLVLTQIFASVAGGYIAGRMRVRWSIHNDEVYFRDTVQGFLTRALASAALFAIAALAAAGSAIAATAVTSAAAVSDAPGPSTLITDRLYRAPGANPELLAAARFEADRLVVRALADEEAVTAADRNWPETDVAEWAGVNAQEAQARVDAAFGEKNARDEARGAVDGAHAATAALSIAAALAMMIGAFVAASASVYGGRERDRLEDTLVST
ncbi:MAG: hypothetical protein WEA77_08735 [Hyphomonas sp.]|uniref:hypothetical protein n=1 Tax=Hyphomonas sp. TaxID=87 RepID=UPI00349FF6A3